MSLERMVIDLSCDILEYYHLRDIERKIAEAKKKEKKSRKGRLWTRKWILRRGTLGASGALIRELAEEDPKSYRTFLRMDENTFKELLSMMNPALQRADTPMRDAIRIGEKLELTLRYLATGDSFESLSKLFRIPQSTISTFLPEVLSELIDKLSPFIKVPTTNEEWLKISTQFQRRWNFPRCVGAVDGKHIRIRCPSNSGSYFYNYKGFFSVILFAIVDADYKFTYVCIGGNGRAGDAAIWEESSFREAVEKNTLNFPPEHVFVGDDAFALKPWMMKPYSKKQLSAKERIFNYRLSRARRISENAFGILAWRFRIFQRPIEVKVETTDKIIMAACALHNWLAIQNPLHAGSAPLADTEDLNTGEVIPGEWRDGVTQLQSIRRLHRSNNYGQDGEAVRAWYANYFMDEGSVPWQWKRAGLV